MNDDYLVALADQRKLVGEFLNTIREGIYDIKQGMINVNMNSPEDSRVPYQLLHNGISDLFLVECERLYDIISNLLSSAIAKSDKEEFETTKNGKTYTFSLDYKNWTSIIVREKDGTLSTY